MGEPLCLVRLHIFCYQCLQPPPHINIKCVETINTFLPHASFPPISTWHVLLQEEVAHFFLPRKDIVEAYVVENDKGIWTQGAL